VYVKCRPGLKSKWHSEGTGLPWEGGKTKPEDRKEVPLLSPDCCFLVEAP